MGPGGARGRRAPGTGWVGALGRGTETGARWDNAQARGERDVQRTERRRGTGRGETTVLSEPHRAGRAAKRAGSREQGTAGGHGAAGTARGQADRRVGEQYLGVGYRNHGAEREEQHGYATDGSRPRGWRGHGPKRRGGERSRIIEQRGRDRRSVVVGARRWHGDERKASNSSPGARSAATMGYGGRRDGARAKASRPPIRAGAARRPWCSRAVERSIRPSNSLTCDGFRYRNSSEVSQLGMGPGTKAR